MGKRILFVTTELFPYVKTGGLGDVAGSLPLELSKDVDIRLFIPGYPAILNHLQDATLLKKFDEFYGATDVRILLGRLTNGMVCYVLSSAQFFDRSGPYVDAQGRDWADNHRRFGALCRAAADLYLYDPAWQPDIIHGNDWHTGLIPAYLAHRAGPRPATAMTIHNLAYQGLFPAATMGELDLPPESFSMHGVEFHGQVGFLKAGLYYADRLTTVSPTYAREIQTPEFGCGLDGLLRARARDLVGILNGIDDDVWNPMTDRHIDKRYDSSKLDAKARNKRALLNDVGLPQTDNPLFGVVGRLTSQKGFDMLLEAAPGLLKRKASMIFLGRGDAALEQQWRDLQKRYPDQVAVNIGYEEAFEHRLHAGSDAIVMPSRFEPCGLVQMYGQRYGAVPIVRETGGLADTVKDAGAEAKASTAGTGFMFKDASARSLEKALDKTVKCFHNKRAWRRIQRNAMAQDFDWSKTAGKYRSLYNSMA